MNSFEANSWNARTFNAWLGFWASTLLHGVVTLLRITFWRKIEQLIPFTTVRLTPLFCWTFSKEQRPQFWKWVSTKNPSSSVICNHETPKWMLLCYWNDKFSIYCLSDEVYTKSEERVAFGNLWLCTFVKVNWIFAEQRLFQIASKTWHKWKLTKNIKSFEFWDSKNGFLKHLCFLIKDQKCYWEKYRQQQDEHDPFPYLA